jgi:glycerol-3-phosphate acyltransferase PlsY
MLERIILAVLAYLLGSVPFGLIIGRVVGKVDIRTAGSRNTGATNVARLVGMKWGLLALALDILKGLVPVLAAKAVDHDPVFLSVVAGLALAGHIWSVFLGFQGGKAVATTIGAFAGLAFWAALIAVGACVAVIALTRYVSLGSLTLGLSLPLACALTGQTAYAPLAFLITLLLFWRHRENLVRLARGQESKLGRKKA